MICNNLIITFQRKLTTGHDQLIDLSNLVNIGHEIFHVSHKMFPPNRTGNGHPGRIIHKPQNFFSNFIQGLKKTFYLCEDMTLFKNEMNIYLDLSMTF